MRYSSKGLKNEFETAVVNESSVFEPLKFYCTFMEIDHEIVATVIVPLPLNQEGQLSGTGEIMNT